MAGPKVSIVHRFHCIATYDIAQSEIFCAYTYIGTYLATYINHAESYTADHLFLIIHMYLCTCTYKPCHACWVIL